MKKWTKVRQLLEDRLVVLERRVQKIDADLTRQNNRLAPDFKEQAAVLQNDEVLTGLELEGRGQIEAIRAALGQIDAGTYGTCTSCQAPIPPRRLEAIPYATMCLSCADLKEREGG